MEGACHDHAPDSLGLGRNPRPTRTHCGATPTLGHLSGIWGSQGCTVAREWPEISSLCPTAADPLPVDGHGVNENEPARIAHADRRQQKYQRGANTYIFLRGRPRPNQNMDMVFFSRASAFDILKASWRFRANAYDGLGVAALHLPLPRPLPPPPPFSSPSFLLLRCLVVSPGALPRAGVRQWIGADLVHVRCSLLVPCALPRVACYLLVAAQGSLRCVSLSVCFDGVLLVSGVRLFF
eukprot:scaffold106555_cov33-Tisochrysis_lutea.AAC.4